jgi:toxin ParE1/3/4
VNDYIVVQPAAHRDLEEIADYLAQRSVPSAIRFSHRSAESFDILLSNPSLGSPFEISNPLLQGLRVWPIKGFRKYLVFYRPREYGIEILRVLHGARDIGKILGQ